MSKCVKVLCVAIFALASVTAQAGIIHFEDFTGEGGAKPNGYTTAANPGIHYTDNVGAGLQAGAFFECPAGDCLAVFDDSDGGGLVIDLDFRANHIDLDFGNDDPAFTVPGDLAELKLFDGLLQVGMVTVVMNRDDLGNQNIAYDGGAFNRAVFTYTDNAGNPFTGPNPYTGLIEIADNITIEQVPAPATLALLGLGLAALGGTRRRRS